MPTNDFSVVREIAPSDDFGAAYRDMGFLVGESIGEVQVRTADGIHLGTKSLGGAVSAEVIVERTGISRRSGGEVYRPVSLITNNVEHWFINDLPPAITLEPLTTPGQQG